MNVLVPVTVWWCCCCDYQTTVRFVLSGTYCPRCSSHGVTWLMAPVETYYMVDCGRFELRIVPWHVP